MPEPKQHRPVRIIDAREEPPAPASARIVKEALTFDDVLLVPGHSLVHPKDTDLGSRVTRGVTLRIPLLSAAMDTVTESQMAIQMAREGGLGFIHKNMPIERQAEEVDRVKRSESGMIMHPITLGASATLRQALALMSRFSISGVPIVEEDGRLIGIITNRDLQFEREYDKPISEVMTREGLVTAPVGTTLETAEKILHQHRIEKLPVVDEKGRLKGLITVKDIFKRRQYPDACKDEHGRLRVGAAIGASAGDLDRARALVDAGVDVIVIDTAHGHSEGVLQAVARVREALPDTELIAGNVGTASGAAALVERGVDAVKVGVGPGSICTTRIVTGVGLPQLTAVMDGVDGAGGRVPVIADGGIRYSGDVVKALASGAESVMMGSMFAGTDESPGEAFLMEGRRYKTVRGMGSLSAMEQGSADRYFQAEARKLVPEGIEARVPYKGPVSDVIFQMVGGLRSGMGYVGAATLAELRDKATFVRQTSLGLRESHPHDVTITREAPNYHLYDPDMTTTVVTKTRGESRAGAKLHVEPRLLLGPGPSPVDPRVLEALSRPTLGHLDPQFLRIMDEVNEGLRQAFGTKNKTTFPVSGTGSAAMEASLANVVEPGDTVIIGVNGAFGGRLVDMARRMGATIVTVEAEWGKIIPPEKVIAALKANPGARALAIVQAETSTGVRQPLDEIGAFVRGTETLLIVDAVTAIGGIPVDVDRIGIDVCYAGTQKCLGVPPGLGPITFSERAMERIRSRKTPCQSWYLDVKGIQTYLGAERLYHHTAPINMVYALHEGLAMVAEEGLEARWKRHASVGEALQKELVSRGWEMFAEEGHRLPELTAAKLPGGREEAPLRAAMLEQFGIEVGGGLGPAKGKVWRIGLMGSGATMESVERVLEAVDQLMAG